MENVKLNGTYRGVLLTADLTTTPNEAAWPDDDIIAGDLTVTIAGVVYAGAKAITKSAVAGETGKHTITLDCTGVAAGAMIELSGEYYIDSVRYYFATEIYVDAGPAIQDSIDSDWVPVLDGGVWKGRTTKRGTATLVIPDKTLKQPDGNDVTDIDTQPIAGFTEE